MHIPDSYAAKKYTNLLSEIMRLAHKAVHQTRFAAICVCAYVYMDVCLHKLVLLDAVCVCAYVENLHLRTSWV
jgi:hypothetical protein